MLLAIPNLIHPSLELPAALSPLSSDHASPPREVVVDQRHPRQRDLVHRQKCGALQLVRALLSRAAALPRS